MKKLFQFVVLVVLVLAAIVVIRAALLKPPTFTVAAATPVPLDNDGAVKRFIGAIQIPTESHYQQPPDAVAMQRFRDYLQQSFPRVHGAMTKQVLPDGGLILTWPGRDTTAAPVVLMGHMDVVPVPTEDLPKWHHAPYSGDLADGFIWGRGTLDDKIHVLSELEAAETLLGRGFTPARTILFCFGDDEENGGEYGAKRIVAFLKQQNVHPEFVVDEGGAIVSGLVPGVAQPLAIVGVAEKGFVDLELSTTGVGGHSSAPPPHTAIGELGGALYRLESHPFPAKMPEVMTEQYKALAPYLPFSKRLVLANLWLFKPLLVYSGIKNQESAGNYRTTTAVDIISGGFKDNALPPTAHATINFRIAPGETTASVAERVRKVIDDPGVTVFDPKASDPRNPSPLSPIDSTGYLTLSNTIRQEFPGAIVSPYLVTAATDASYYSAITPNVYRFLAVDADISVMAMIHGLNERIAPEKYLKSVQFMTQLIQNIQ